MCACALHLCTFNILPLLTAQRRAVAHATHGGNVKNVQKMPVQIRKCKRISAKQNLQHVGTITTTIAKKKKSIYVRFSSLGFCWLVGSKSFHCLAA